MLLSQMVPDTREVCSREFQMGRARSFTQTAAFTMENGAVATRMGRASLLSPTVPATRETGLKASTMAVGHT